MGKKTILYRGNLKSCNYNCSYCPFSKHKPLKQELKRDRQNFQRFCKSVEKRAEENSIGAVFVTPYGEASIHSWYWEGLAHLSGLSEIDRVGMQTNLSFSLILPDGGRFAACSSNSVDNCIAYFDFCGGKREKLCIWATFHPEMTDADTFVSKCHKLAAHHIRLCVGAVGVPENIPLLRKLREKLSKDIYFWINRMDGLRRNYSFDEIRAFLELDPFFEYELQKPAADVTMCQDRCFVEADGTIRTCNISRRTSVNWYDDGGSKLFEPRCSQKSCSCYLAYGGRADFDLKHVFGSYPVFRIPKRFRAVFLDLDGTLTPKGDKKGISEQICGTLKALKRICPVFLATSLPEIEVRRRLKKNLDLFSGGIFASGAYLYLNKQTESSGGEISALCYRKKDESSDALECALFGSEKVYPAEIRSLSEIARFAEEAKARIQIYRKHGMIYKMTLIKRRYGTWNNRECSRIAELLEPSGCRFFTEDNCLQIVDKKRNKGTAVEEVCEWIGISPEDVLAVGNDKEDAAMESVCGAYIHRRKT